MAAFAKAVKTAAAVTAIGAPAAAAVNPQQPEGMTPAAVVSKLDTTTPKTPLYAGQGSGALPDFGSLPGIDAKAMRAAFQAERFQSPEPLFSTTGTGKFLTPAPKIPGLDPSGDLFKVNAQMPPSAMAYEIRPAFDQKFKTWTPTGKEPANERYNHYVGAAVNPDGTKAVVAVNFSGVQVLDFKTGKQTEIFKYGSKGYMVENMKWSPDGTKVAFVVSEKIPPKDDTSRPTFGNSAVIVHDVATGKQLVAKAIPGHGQVDWDAKGEKIALAAPRVREGDPRRTTVEVSTINVADGKVTSFGTIDTKGKDPDVRGVKLLASGDKIAFSHVHSPDSQHSVTVMDSKGVSDTTNYAKKYFGQSNYIQVDSGKLTRSSGTLTEVDGKVLYTPPTMDGQTFAHGTGDKELAKFGKRVEMIAHSDASGLIAVFGRDKLGGPGEIRLFNAKSKEQVGSIEVAGRPVPRDLSFSPDGKTVRLVTKTAEDKDNGEAIKVEAWTLRLKH